MSKRLFEIKLEVINSDILMLILMFTFQQNYSKN